jgi:hypothetical protein
MTKLKKALTICALGMLQLAVAAQDRDAPGLQHSEHEQHVGPSAETLPGQAPMAGMHEQMLAMREQMARIHATQDPAERQRLMHEHMQSMQQAMHMMGTMHAQQRRSGGRCEEADAPCRMNEMQAENETMRQRMSAMESRLDSMQQLMREMMDHVDEAQDPR